jgi:cell division protein ZapA
MKTFEVKILGQRYKVRSDEGEDYIQELASFVNDQIADVQKSSKSVATHNVAILAALNIADDLFKLRDQDAQFQKEVKERIRRILKLISSGQTDESKA